MPSAAVETIPLYPRRRVVGSPFGGFTSLRRGQGSDVASSRPYEPGDHVQSIDWKGSARLSAAHGSDEFIVRERHAEEMARVALVVDRRPEMALYPPELPWLHKPAAVAAAAELLVASALNQRGLVGYLDYASHPDHPDPGTPFWKPPRSQSGVWQGDMRERTLEFLSGGFDAPDDNVDQALAFLSTSRTVLPRGSFVFVLSDFTRPLSPDPWVRAVGRGWDVVPVVVQDPTWEQSFPDVSGVLVPLADARGGGLRHIRLDPREVEERRQENEARLASLRGDFLGLGLDPVLIADANPDAVRAAFLEWVDVRVLMRGRRW